MQQAEQQDKIIPAGGGNALFGFRGEVSNLLLSRSRIGDQVALTILHEIIASGSSAETFLPPEKDLARLLGVGRSAIREALSLLTTAHVVRILHGKGTMIESESQWDVLSPLVTRTLEESGRSAKLNSDLFEVRRILECHAAEIAATLSTAAEREALTSKADQLMEEAVERRVSTLDFLVTDREFHDVLATISGNVALRQIIRQVHVHLATAWTEVDLDMDDRAKVAKQHVEIAKAISSGDVSCARSAMTAHMNYVEEEQRSEDQR
jgi:DNA-binding FadR family transcriptional regulator